MSTVTVHCSVSGGLHLRLFEMQEGPLGIREARQVGTGVVLHGGDNPGVDSAFMEQWFQQHKGTSLAEALRLTEEID